MTHFIEILESLEYFKVGKRAKRNALFRVKSHSTTVVSNLAPLEAVVLAPSALEAVDLRHVLELQRPWSCWHLELQRPFSCGTLELERSWPSRLELERSYVVLALSSRGGGLVAPQALEAVVFESQALRGHGPEWPTLPLYILKKEHRSWHNGTSSTVVIV